MIPDVDPSTLRRERPFVSNQFQTSGGRPRRSFEFSPRYRPALVCCLCLQAPVFCLSALIMDLEHRSHILCCFAMMAQWFGVVLIMGRRPLAPTQADLLFIRYAILPLVFATPWIAQLVWAVIGHSSQSGMDRLFPRPPR
jgi:hypothetical protein